MQSGKSRGKSYRYQLQCVAVVAVVAVAVAAVTAESKAIVQHGMLQLVIA